MEIFKKKKLFCFLFLFFAFIPFINVKADEVYGGKTFPDVIKDGNDSYMIVKNGAGNDYFGFGTWLITYNKADIPYVMIDNINSSSYPLTLTLFKSPTGSKYDAITYKAYKLVNDSWTLTYNRENVTTSSYKYIQGLSNIYYSSENIYFYKYSDNKTLTLYYDDSGLVSRKASECSNLKETITYTTSSSDTGYENVLYKPFEILKPFEELIPTSLYKGLVFSFDTSNVTSEDILSFNYNFYVSDENYNILNSTFEIPYFGYNGKDIYSDGSYTLNYQTNQLDAIPRNNYINDNFLQNFKYFESEYKLFVNFEMLEDNYLYAYLDSPLNYTVEYIEREENLYYFDEVDITGKYGVVFIPNDVTNDYVTVMKFLEKGKYSVQLRDSYSESNENYNILEYYQIGFCDNLDITGLVPVNCVDSYFLSLNNYFREKKQFVYVKNENNYDSSVKSVITYDTRYYTAYIQEYSNSNIEIINPNTGETDIFGPMTDFDNVYYEISNENILELMETFLEDLQQTSDTFNYMWNNFYSIMPDILKAFLQVITHLLCVWVFIKIVGYD